MLNSQAEEEIWEALSVLDSQGVEKHRAEIALAAARLVDYIHRNYQGETSNNNADPQYRYRNVLLYAFRVMAGVSRDPEADVYVASWGYQGGSRQGVVGGIPATFLIIQCLKSLDSVVALMAANVPGAVGERTAVGPLVEALGDPRLNVVRQVVLALGAIGDRRVLPALSGLRWDPILKHPVSLAVARIEASSTVQSRVRI